MHHQQNKSLHKPTKFHRVCNLPVCQDMEVWEPMSMYICGHSHQIQYILVVTNFSLVDSAVLTPSKTPIRLLQPRFFIQVIPQQQAPCLSRRSYIFSKSRSSWPVLLACNNCFAHVIWLLIVHFPTLLSLFLPFMLLQFNPLLFLFLLLQLPLSRSSYFHPSITFQLTTLFNLFYTAA